MSSFLVAIMFGAGVAGFAYTRIGRRVGYSNTQNVMVVEAVIFILASLFFYTILRYELNIQ